MLYIEKLTTMGLKLAETVSLLGPQSVAFCDTIRVGGLGTPKIPAIFDCWLLGSI
jgi:hypothetical protein